MVGLTPTVDQHSIKIEGTGSAIITDIAVELLPNRDIFEEIYPDSDSESDEDISEDDNGDEDRASDALKQVREKLVALHDEQARINEALDSAMRRLDMLNRYADSLDRRRNVDIAASVETYRKEREKLFDDRAEAMLRERALAEDIKKLLREEARIEKLEARERAREMRQQAKLKQKERRRREERKREKERIRREREQFWPRYCYTVRITLDPANFTPLSSRRSSIAGAVDVKVVTEPDADLAARKEADPAVPGATCDLTLSYVTWSAFWSPSYDLALSTTTNTAVLCFDAQLTNMTSETWSNARVLLSTSQASFSGVQDDVPKLVPWRLKIATSGGYWDGRDLVQSREERAEREIWKSARDAIGQQQMPQAGLFGIGSADQAQEPAFANTATASVATAPAPGAHAGLPGPRGAEPAAVTAGFMGRSKHNWTVLKAAAPPAENSSSSSSAARPTLFSAARKSDLAETTPSASARSSLATENEICQEGFDDRTVLEPAPEIAFQDSAFDETGLTATFDLPQPKTLKPSATASKQRVARAAFSNVVFSRTVVAKYRPAAYLKARLQNTSKLTLLGGPAGLTLDGTFLGRANLPRCSAGDAFSVPLGVDPAIRVEYPKPDVSRSTTGVFSKGDHSVYTRTVALTNTRAAAGRPVTVTVLDQVPVSEDEKIRVDVLRPAGMQVGGNPVAVGEPDSDWGSATATLKRDGVVSWRVLLNAGKSVKLPLQYAVAFPTGERVVQC